jgi:hypothetical protein
MRRIRAATLAVIVSLAGMPHGGAADCGCGHVSCTGSGDCPACVPACKATWDEAKTKKPKYSMKCEYACVRGRDSWHAPPPECRSSPPCGDIIVKKRFYKTDGPEKVERVPKYEVEMVPAEPCHCAACSGVSPLCWWNPLSWVSCLLDR